MISCNDFKKYDEQANILVSVCITSYNRPEGLNNVLRCITEQTHKKLQIIISDDCSPNPDVLKVILNYTKDSRIEYFIQKENLYYSKNLKFALDKVRGDFVMWCDDDDWYHPDYIKKCLAALSLEDKKITAFSYYLETDEFFIKKDGYPNQAALLNRLTHKNSFIRVLNYLFAYNGYGYCNIYYGLHRATILQWFNPDNFGMEVDMDVGMKLIGAAPLILVHEYLFKKNVGTQKEYLDAALHGDVNSQRKNIIFSGISIFLNCLKQSINYFKVLNLPQSVVIIVFSPLWVISIVIFNTIPKLKIIFKIT